MKKIFVIRFDNDTFVILKKFGSTFIDLIVLQHLKKKKNHICFHQIFFYGKWFYFWHTLLCKYDFEIIIVYIYLFFIIIFFAFHRVVNRTVHIPCWWNSQSTIIISKLRYLSSNQTIFSLLMVTSFDRNRLCTDITIQTYHYRIWHPLSKWVVHILK